jgi:ParB-like chromosome segregation protein Spo0J
MTAASHPNIARLDSGSPQPEHRSANRSDVRPDPTLDVSHPHRQSWRAFLPIHPAAELFPMLGSDELLDLGNDIAQNGMTHPIVLWEEPTRPGERSRYLLLDGRNRLSAMEAVGLRFTVDQRTNMLVCRHKHWRNPEVVSAKLGIDPDTFVISANAHRRHLSRDQKRQAIAGLLKSDPSKSDRELGRAVQADNKTVASVRADLERREEIPHVNSRKDSKGRA